MSSAAPTLVVELSGDVTSGLTTGSAGDIILLEDGEATSLWAYVLWLVVWPSADACVTSSFFVAVCEKIMKQSLPRRGSHRNRLSCHDQRLCFRLDYIENRKECQEGSTIFVLTLGAVLGILFLDVSDEAP